MKGTAPVLGFLLGAFAVLALYQMTLVDAFTLYRRQVPEVPGIPNPSQPPSPPPSTQEPPIAAPPPITNFNGSIADYLQSNESSFSTIARLLNETGIPVNSSNITLFAPNNDAFNNLPSWISNISNQSIANSSALPAFQALMLYHIHPGSDFSGKNFSANRSNDEAIGGACLFPGMGGSWAGENESNTTSNNSTSLPTALRPFNLTIYTVPSQQNDSSNQSNSTNSTWWVNDGQVMTVTNTTSGYVFELSRVVSPMYYLNRSIYDIQISPPQLGQNYTFPQPVASPPPVNLSSVYSLEERRMQQEARAVSKAFGFE